MSNKKLKNEIRNLKREQKELWDALECESKKNASLLRKLDRVEFHSLENRVLKLECKN